MESTGWLFTPLFPGQICIWKCLFLRREENRSTRRKTLGAETRSNNKLNPHMTPSPGIDPGPHWWEAAWEANAHHPCSPVLRLMFGENYGTFQDISITTEFTTVFNI